MTTHRDNVQIWLTVLLLTAILLICIVPQRQTTRFTKQLCERRDTWERIKSLSREKAIELLTEEAKRARKIVPDFPPFPKLWLEPPKEKSSYGSISERYCLEFMELLFPGHSFDKVRPRWLMNTVHQTGRCLELDGFCEELSLAIEYNGVQHYVWPNFTKMTEREFSRQKERDALKAQVCKERGVCLLKIPYTVPLEKIPLAIYATLIDST